MAFYPGLAPLRDVLADLYTTEGHARVVVGDAGIPEQEIDFGGSALEFWQSILSAAHRTGRVQNVIDAARKTYSTHARLREAARLFHDTPVPDLPTRPGDSGSAAVEHQSSQSVFDQRGQTVSTQYNIAGDYNPSNAEERTDAIELLRQLLAEIGRAQSAGALHSDQATDAEYQVKKALNQAQEPEPNKRTIVGHLTTARDIIATASAAAGLVTAITQTIQMVQKIF